MTRLLGGVLAAALFAAACGGTGTPTIPASGAIGSAATGAQQQLCDPTNQASLSSLSTQLATLDPNSDTTALQSALGTAATNLGQLTVSGNQSTLKDAAVTAIQAVQAGLSHPQTVQDTATQAASALTALSAAICV